MENGELVQALLAKIQELSEKVETMSAQKTSGAAASKNHQESKPKEGRKYILLSKSLGNWGKIPQQQRDIADILSHCMELGKEYTEKEVYDMLIDFSGDYTQLVNSKQHVTYLFRYYRNIKDEKHLGFIGRGFMRQIG